MYEVEEFLQAAVEGNEVYFDQLFFAMKKNGLSTTTIKSKIEKLDSDQYSVLHYAVRYHHCNLVRKLIEEFHCGIPIILAHSLFISFSQMSI